MYTNDIDENLSEDFAIQSSITTGLSPFSGTSRSPRGSRSPRSPRGSRSPRSPRGSFSGTNRGPRSLRSRRGPRSPRPSHRIHHRGHRFHPGLGNYWGGQFGSSPYVVQPLLAYPSCQCITHSEHPTTINYNPNIADNLCDPNNTIDPCFCYSTCPDRFGNLDRQWYNCSAPDRGGLGSGGTTCRFRE